MGDDDEVRRMILVAEARELTRRLAEVPNLAARRRVVVRELVGLSSVAATARELGVSRQAVHQLLAGG